MTEGPAPVFSPWPVSLWLLATMSFAALSASIAASLLSTSLILDLAALWPLAVIGLILIPIGLIRSGAKVAAPAVLLVWAFLGLGLHLLAPQILPSSAGDISSGVLSDEIGTAQASFAEVDRIDVGFAAQADLLELSMLREGGAVAPPEITPVVGDGRADLVVGQRENPGYFRFSGWSTTLDIGPAWELSVISPALTVDTRGATQVSLSATGTGTISLSAVGNPSDLELAGIFTLLVPRGLGIEVLGPADVPADWVTTSQGSAVPDAIASWLVIVADGSQVTVSYQGS